MIKHLKNPVRVFREVGMNLFFDSRQLSLMIRNMVTSTGPTSPFYLDTTLISHALQCLKPHYNAFSRLSAMLC
jgi:hypothetical protein